MFDETWKENLLKSSGNEFFEVLDKYLMKPIPVLIKKSLSLCDYDSAIVLAKINDDAIFEIEEYFRNIVTIDILDDGENFDDYFGRFKKCPNKFRFTGGQKMWLRVIAEACRNAYKHYCTEEPSTSNVVRHSNAYKLLNVFSDQTVEGLRTHLATLHSWMRAQDTLIEPLKNRLLFQVAAAPRVSYELRCPAVKCFQTFTILSDLSAKRNHPTAEQPQIGNKIWLSAIQKHLLQSHSINNMQGSDSENDEIGDENDVGQTKSKRSREF